jgi:hypothetical protein
MDRMHRSRFIAGAIMVAVVASLAVTGCSVASVVPGQAPTQGPAQAPDGTAGAGLVLGSAPALSGFSSSSRIAPHNPFTGPPADPFAGTPADHWADGAAGIRLPAARPVGEYSVAQVESAYQLTRKLLIAANLDKRTLLGGSPAVFASLLTSQQRARFLTGLDKRGLDKTGYPRSTRTMVMSFAPAGAQLVGSVIKVHGTMRARAATDKGGYPVLDIDVDYLFVYPIDPPHRPTAWMRVINEVSWTVSFGNWAGAASPFEPWVTGTGIGGISGALCGTTDGYQHPDYPDTGARPSVSPTGTPVDPYQMGRPAPPGCHATTGT